MPRQLGRTARHHAINASTQKSLLPPVPNTSVNAPVSSTSTPKGVTFSCAGGSWSHALSALPSLPVRVFPPSGVVAYRHLRLRVDRDFQRLGVVLHLLADGLDVGEDGVGLRGLLQGLALLDTLEAVVHAVEDVAQGPHGGHGVLSVALVKQRLVDLGGGQVGVATRGLQLRVGLCVRLDDGPDVSAQLRVFVLGALAALGDEVLHAADASLSLVQSGVNRVAAPAEAAFSLAGAAVTQSGGDFGSEQAALMALEAAGGGADQVVERLCGGVHGG